MGGRGAGGGGRGGRMGCWGNREVLNHRILFTEPMWPQGMGEGGE